MNSATSLLLESSAHSDLDGVKEALALPDVDVNAFNEGDVPALIIACEDGDLEVVELLLDAGAHINGWATPHPEDLEADEPRDSSLFVAMTNGHMEIVDLLMEKGADVNWPLNAHKAHLLHSCSTQGDAEMVKRLLDLGVVDVNVKNDHGSTALHFAVLDGHIKVVQLLLDAGADIEAADDEGEVIVVILVDCCDHVSSTSQASSFVIFLYSSSAWLHLTFAAKQ